MPIELILGTAGHIDHGKTSLVKALTGTDPDRLPEEKLRGITIELGFAQLDLGDIRLGIVDVPGHERFVRNMLAGATGIDLALLVVAADDSVKPQTREHLEILKLLRLPAGVIALTKCDLPAADWMDLVEEEVRDLVQGSFLEAAPLIRTSVHTGEGLSELKAALAAAALLAAEGAGERAGDRRRQGPFRMAIDRTFTIAGHGTVVTGSVASGSVRVGDELEIQPGNISVRVRGLHNHDTPAEEVHRGQRAAINLAGIHHDAIARGQELATPGHLAPSRLITCQVTLLPDAPRPLKNRTRVRCHVGTAELMANLVLLESDKLEPGATGFAQLFLSEPAVTVWGQPCVLRSESPVHTLGGGRVVDPQAQRLAREDQDVVRRLGELISPDEATRAGAALFLADLAGWRPSELPRTAGVTDTATAHQALVQRGEVRELVLAPGRTLLVHRSVLEPLFERIAATLAKEHDAQPLRTSIDRSRIAHRFAYLGTDQLVETILLAMEQDGRLKSTARGIALPGRGPQLSQNEQKLATQIVATYLASGCQPPTLDEIRAQAQRNQAVVPQLVALAAADGLLVEIAPGLFLHADVEQQLRQRLTPGLANGGLTVSQIRELLTTSRKFAVPICEYLDRSGFTRRQGDLRVLAG